MKNKTTEMVSVPRDILSMLIDMSNAHIEDIDSGIEEGIYDAAENADIGRKHQAVEAAETLYRNTMRDNAKAQEGDFGLTPDKLEEKYHPEHPFFDRDDWRQEVHGGDTKLGYWEWVMHNIESHYFDPCESCGAKDCDKEYVEDEGMVCSCCAANTK